MKIEKLLVTTALALLAAQPGAAPGENAYSISANFADTTHDKLVKYHPFAPFGAAATFSISEGVLTITAPPSPAPHISDQVAGMYLEHPEITDGTASIEVWNWDTSTAPVFFLNGRSTDGAQGTYNFYSVNFNPVAFPEGTGAYLPNPSLAIIKWVNNVPQLPSLASFDLTNVPLDPNGRYQVTLSMEGSTITGKLFKLDGGPQLIATVEAQDSAYTHGTWGFFITDKASKGIPAGNNPVRISVDNFSVNGTPVPSYVSWTENFDAGAHSDLMTRYQPFAPFGAPASFTYADGALTLTAPASPAPQISDQVVGLYLDQPRLTDGMSSIDLWNWNPATEPVFFLNGRSTEAGPGTYNFYSVNFNPTTFENATGAFLPNPSLNILKWVNNVPQLPSLASFDLSNVSLDPNQRHRLTLTMQGSVISAKLYRLDPVPVLLGSVQAQDTSYTSGTWAFYITDKASKGNPAGNNPVRVSVDNFVVEGVAAAPALTIRRAVVLSWPAPAIGPDYILQSAPSVGGPWTDENSVAAVNGQVTVTVLVTEEVQVFRLRQADAQ